MTPVVAFMLRPSGRPATVNVNLSPAPDAPPVVAPASSSLSVKYCDASILVIAVPCTASLTLAIAAPFAVAITVSLVPLITIVITFLMSEASAYVASVMVGFSASVVESLFRFELQTSR